MHELYFDGKKFISSKRASEITKYTKDYVGQLARGGKVTARLVGRNWYIDEASILEHANLPSVRAHEVKQETEEGASASLQTQSLQATEEGFVEKKTGTLSRLENRLNEKLGVSDDQENDSVLSPVEVATSTDHAFNNTKESQDVDMGESGRPVYYQEAPEILPLLSKQVPEIEDTSLEEQVVELKKGIRAREEEETKLRITFSKENLSPDLLGKQNVQPLSDRSGVTQREVFQKPPRRRLSLLQFSLAATLALMLTFVGYFGLTMYGSIAATEKQALTGAAQSSTQSKSEGFLSRTIEYRRVSR